MHEPIPRDCPALVIEGIPGAGKTALQERLQREIRDRPVHIYAEEALLFHWMHIWIPGIHALRLQLMQAMLAHIQTTLLAQPDALFLLTRFHLSHVLLGGDGDDPAYLRVVEQLAALGAETWVPIVPAAEIAGRAAHCERRDPLWQAHLQRRLATSGYPDIGTMYLHYQQDLHTWLERQPLRYRLLPPESR